MSKVKIFSLLFFFILNHSGLSGQISHSQFSIRYYTSSKGLSNNSVISLAVDFKGYLWIGTEDGLNRFDGKEFKVYRNIRGDRASLSGNYIRCLYFDRDSNLWVGTTGGGLSMYNRKTDSFRNFAYIDKDSTSLSQMDVSVIFQDKDGVLWIGTDGGGLNRFNSRLKNFQRFNKILPVKGGLSSGKILDISEDSKGRLILASWDGGLNILDKSTGIFSVIHKKPGAKNALISNNIWSLHALGRDRFLLGFFLNGIEYYNARTGKFKSIPFPEKDSNPTVYSIIDINEKEVWFGTNAGLYYTTYHWTGEEYQFDMPLHKFNNLITFQLIHDNNNIIWAVNFENGFVQIHPQNSFFHIHQLSIKPEELGWSNIFVNAICEDEKGKIILGTQEGIFYYNPGNGKIDYSKINYSLSATIREIKDFQKDKEGNIWISRNFDLARLNSSTGKIESFFKLPANVFPSERNGYNSVLTEGDGKFWLATENGLYYLDKQEDKVETIIDASSIYMGNNIYQVVSLASDKDNVYAGTHGGGLAVVNKHTHIPRIFQNDPARLNSITDNHINQVFVDKNDSIWLVTYNGLDRFNKSTNEFKHYNTRKFQDQYFKAIVEDYRGNLWISSNDGISKFNPSTGKVTNYYFYNQISQSSFQVQSAFRGKNGELYFGRIGAFISFNPDSIQENPTLPKVLITDFKINNLPVKISDKSPLKVNIEEAKRVELNYDESSFSFGFVATDLVYPERNQYAHRLENFENWVYSGNNNTANYTNIPPGKYTFHVMASNQDGIWNEQGTNIEIWIRQPWWDSRLFRISFAFALLITFGLLYYWNHWKILRDRRTLKKLVELRTSELNKTNRILNEQNEELEQQKEELLQHREELQSQSTALKEANSMLEEKKLEVERQNEDLSLHRDNLELLVSERTRELESAKEKAEESDRLKSAFLANMSHEIRTPLNAIVGFSYFFSDSNLDSETRERYFRIIKSNSDALLVLIDDILDLSRIEAGQLQFKIRPVNAREIMDELFEQYGKFTKPDLNFEIESSERLIILTDPNRFKQILNNLLSNAFKFTEKGIIKFGAIPEKNGFITFYVNDTGIGIDPVKQEIIFERFMKIEEDQSKLFSGTGLGLAISRRLTEALGGSIWVESETGKGSSFYFTQPASSNDIFTIPHENSKAVKTFNLLKKIKIAIAEDQDDNVKLLQEYFAKRYIEVLSFRNGLEISEYFQRLSITDVQLILMDIKMPVMDGYEAARRIRKRFPNIPIVAQTAYALANEIEKMQNEGFAHILTKPVNLDHLSLIIEKL